MRLVPGQFPFAAKQLMTTWQKATPKASIRPHWARGNVCLLSLSTPPPLLQNLFCIQDAPLKCSCECTSPTLSTLTTDISDDFLCQWHGLQIREERERSLSIYYIPSSLLVLYVVIIASIINECEKVFVQGTKHISTIVFH